MINCHQTQISILLIVAYIDRVRIYDVTVQAYLSIHDMWSFKCINDIFHNEFLNVL